MTGHDALSFWGGSCDGRSGLMVVVDGAGGAVGFDDADGRVGVLGRSAGGDGAAGERETHSHLFFSFFFPSEKGAGVDWRYGCRGEYDLVAGKDAKLAINEQRRGEME